MSKTRAPSRCQALLFGEHGRQCRRKIRHKGDHETPTGESWARAEGLKVCPDCGAWKVTGNAGRTCRRCGWRSGA